MFTSTNSITGAIEEIVERAETELHIVSPYIQFEKKDEQWSRLTKSLKSKNEKIQIIFITKKPDKKDPNARKKEIQEIKEKLQSYANEIWLVPNLHAKCYFNGTRALITSMNMYLHSTKDNFEIGIEFEDEENLKLIQDYLYVLVDNGEEILSDEVSQPVKSNKLKITLKYKKETAKTFRLYSEDQSHLGFCIVCKEEIDLDTRKIRCFECWEKKKSGYAKGTHCHICGIQASTSTNKPACSSCYKQIKKINYAIQSKRY